MGGIEKKIRSLLITLIKGYQYFISPLKGQCCRFYPSCSTYTKDAISQYGVSKGSFMGLKRLLKCHPWHSGGVDPVPNSTKEK